MLNRKKWLWSVYSPSCSEKETELTADSIIFVPEANQNPYTAWQDSKKDKFWPEFVGNQLHNCRVWSYGYHGDYSDEGPISTAATILINSYAAQRRIDTVTHAYLPALLFKIEANTVRLLVSKACPAPTQELYSLL